MGGHAAPRGQDAGGVEHALEVLGRGLDAHQDRFATRFGQQLLGILRKEYDGARRSARRGGQPLDDHLGLLHGLFVENGVEQLVELRGLAAEHRRALVDQPLAEHVHGDLDHRRARALTVAALEHPELPVLDGELDVLHVGEVLLQPVLDGEQLLVNVGHHLLERGVFGATLLLGDILRLRPAARSLEGDLLGGSDAGHHVLALGVDEVFAVKEVLARGGVARESDARGGIVAHVAEDHRLHRDGRAPLGGDVVELAVEDGPFVHPRAENGADGAPELRPRVGRELLARLPQDGLLEFGDQLAQVVGGQVGVIRHAAFFFLLLDK